jgi:hypothetical protein
MEHHAMKEHGGVEEWIHSIYITKQYMLLPQHKFAGFRDHNIFIFVKTRFGKRAAKPLNITGAW